MSDFIIPASVLLFIWLASSAHAATQLRLEVDSTYENGKVTISGRTNLPDGAELIAGISRKESNFAGDQKTKIAGGQFRAGPFSDGGAPLPPGEYTIKITGGPVSVQPASVRERLGPNYSNYTGPSIKRSRLGTVLEWQGSVTFPEVVATKAPTQPKPPSATRGPLEPPMPNPQPVAVQRCPSADLPPFPWPDAPLPSVTALVPRYLISRDERKPMSLLAVGARLEGAISRAGYRQLKYLGADCKGFAIVLDLEHIEADGKRKRGPEGFAPPNQEADFNLIQYVKRLFYAPPGHYRQIVFVVSDQRITNATAAPTEGKLRAIARDGTTSVPRYFANVPYTSKHVVLALIYEFEKGPRDGDLKVVPPVGRLGGTVHLMKAQLF